jgi:hypothetical protein
MHSPDPQNEWPATRQSDGTKFARASRKKASGYSVSLETQVYFYLLLPTVLLSALLALLDARQ